MPPQSNMVTLTCEYCGEEFSRPASKVNRRGRSFCSVACAQQAMRTKVDVICKYCGKSFSTFLSYRKDGGGRFCSIECGNMSRRGKVERHCVVCGTTFLIKPFELRKGGGAGKCCSISCRTIYKKAQRTKDPQSFIKQWVRVDPETGCWEWQRGKVPSGYGTTSYDGRPRLAHRLSAHAFKGFNLDSPLFVCHHCDNPSCCNPDHLFVGTPADNHHDMVAKGRNVNPPRNPIRNRDPERVLRGEKVASARLTEQKVREIRRQHQSGTSMTSLAKQYGMNISTISQVVRRVTWRHVE